MLLSTTENKERLQTRLDAARARTDELFGLLRPGAVYQRPVPERHRLIFYLGHLEAFDWNQVCRGALGMSSFHSEFDKLFEFGIDPEPGKAPADEPADWPSVAEVQKYNATVRRKMDDALAEAPEQILNVALEHRLMHAETLAYLLHNLSYEHKSQGSPASTNYRAATVSDRFPPPLAHARGSAGAINYRAANVREWSRPLIEIPAGQAKLGQDPKQFGWDNEFARHTVDVAAFAIAKYKITNGEYLDFVRAGAKSPHFWLEQEGEYFYRGMFEIIPLPLDWPVYVTHDAAQAFADWKNKSLPSEAQFHRVAYGRDAGDDSRPFPWGSEKPAFAHGNFDFHRWDPMPVSAAAAGDSAFGVSQLAGNGWEWTSTVFGPFAGFKSLDFYPGYSANFFDGAHYVLKGASPRTAECFLRKSFRNWFRPNYPYVYSGFRLVEN